MSARWIPAVVGVALLASTFVLANRPVPTAEAEPTVPTLPVSTPTTPTPPANHAVTADGAVQIGLHVDRSLVLTDDGTGHLLVEVQGSEDAIARRTPVAMTIVVDTSGSMAGLRLFNARQAAIGLVDRLADGDRISLVTYGSYANVLLDNVTLGEDRSYVQSVIGGLDTSGNTCMSCGLDTALSVVSRAPSGFTSRVVMLSDGHANRGDASEAGLSRRASALLEAGVATSTIGVGQDYNETLMTRIATSGTGGYYFVPDSSAIAQVLEREMDGLSRTVARDLVLTLAPGAGITIGDAPVVGATRQGDHIVVRIGQLAAGEVRELVWPLQYATGDLEEGIRVSATWADADGQEEGASASVDIARTDDAAASLASSNERVVVRERIVRSATTIEQAMNDFAEGNFEAAEAALGALEDDLAATAAVTGSAELEEELDNLMEVQRTIAEPEAVDAETRRSLRMQNTARSYEFQRGSGAADAYHGRSVIH